MPVHQEQLHILSDMRIELLIYRILLLAPFEIIGNQKIVTTWRVKIYMYTILFIVATLRLYLFILLALNQNTLQQLFLFNGELWMYVELFSFVISALLFVCIVTSGLLTSKHQIKFYQDLYDFDVKLNVDFGITVIRSRMRTINEWVLFVSLTYNVGDFIYAWINFVPTALNFYQKFAYFCTCYFSNIIGFISALQFVKCAQLCRERIAIIRKLIHDKYHTERIENVLNLYAHIRSQILLINKFMGFVVLSKLVHDFTMGTSILYMLFSSSYDDGIMEFWQLLWWLSHTIIGTLLITLFTEMLMTDVSKYMDMTLPRIFFYQYVSLPNQIKKWVVIVSNLNTDDMSVSTQKVVSILFIYKSI